MPTAYLNDLSGLLPTFFFAVQTIQEEPTALIQSCTVNAELEQIAKGMTATYDISPPAQSTPIVPGVLPVINGETAGKGTLTITDAESCWFEYTGEEQRQLMIAGIYQNKYLNQIKQRIRTLRNNIEAKLAALYVGASRCVGTAGTAPFSFTSPLSGMEDFAKMTKEMTDTGCPSVDRHLALSAISAQAIRNLPNLFKVNEAGEQSLLRSGNLGTIQSLSCKESGQIARVPLASLGTNASAQSGTGYVLNGALAKGTTVITLKSGTGTIIAGDIFTPVTTDATRQYMVIASTVTNSTGTITIAAPGLMVALPDAEPLTFVHDATGYMPNPFFTRDAITLVARQPLLPGFGGSAGGSPGSGIAGGILLDTQLLPDPATGLTYQVAMWSLYRMIAIEIGITYGMAVTNPQDLFVLLG